MSDDLTPTTPASSERRPQIRAIVKTAPRRQPLWMAALTGTSGVARLCALLLASGWGATVALDAVVHHDEHVTISGTLVLVLAILMTIVGAAEALAELQRRRLDRVVVHRQDPLVQAWLRRTWADEPTAAGWIPWAEPDSDSVRVQLIHAAPDDTIDAVTFTVDRETVVDLDDLSSIALGNLRAEYEEIASELEHSARESEVAAALVADTQREDHARTQIELDGALDVLHGHAVRAHPDIAIQAPTESRTAR